MSDELTKACGCRRRRAEWSGALYLCKTCGGYRTFGRSNDVGLLEDSCDLTADAIEYADAVFDAAIKSEQAVRSKLKQAMWEVERPIADCSRAAALATLAQKCIDVIVGMKSSGLAGNPLEDRIEELLREVSDARSVLHSIALGSQKWQRLVVELQRQLGAGVETIATRYLL